MHPRPPDHLDNWRERMAVCPQWVIDRWGVPPEEDNCNGHGSGRLAEGELLIEGHRNERLTSIAGALRRAGLDGDEIFAALDVINRQRGDPPLEERDVRKIARSISRYPPDAMAGVTFKGIGPIEVNDHDAADSGGKKAFAFGPPVAAPDLKLSEGPRWLWEGYLAPGSITLITSLWKAGKTTLLAHLLKGMESGTTFCGQELLPGRALVVTEESENRWAERRQAHQWGPNVEFLIRPFRAKCEWGQWTELIAYLKGLCAERAFDLVVFDTLSNLWPVRDENDAAHVQTALMPLHAVCEKASLAVFHHNRKGDGQEATAARGSGALCAFVDTIVELRRYAPADRRDRRRVLTGYGRYDETPTEIVVELGPDGYVVHGDRADCGFREDVEVIKDMLPPDPPGMSVIDVAERWPIGHKPGRNRMIHALRHGAECGLWVENGEGVRGDPFRYFKVP